MRILGIYDDHNCGCAVIEDGRILSAIEEERLSRIKLHSGNTQDGPPVRSLREVLKQTKSDNQNIDKIAVAIAPPAELLKYVLNDLFKIQKHSKWILASMASKSITWDRYFLMYPYFYNWSRIRRVKKLLKEFELDHLPIDYVDHHTAHAASAYYTSGRPKSLIVTLDGQGDGEGGTIFKGENGQLEKIKSIPSYNSIGLFYNFFTWMLGFKPNRHEGKVTGLAAYGDYSKMRHHFESMFSYDGEDFSYDLAKKIFHHAYPHRTKYNKLVEVMPFEMNGHPKEHIAAGIQSLCEDLVSKFVSSIVEKTGEIDVCLAGGVFANVRINQKVAEIDKVNSVFIFPAMGDGGLSAGAALYSYFMHDNNAEDFGTVPKIDDVYLGPEYSEKEMEAELKNQNMKYEYFGDLPMKVAELLADGKVIARFNGRMEFGPRALGNRSILYQTTDATVNDWLNERLNRTEFMPFAPATVTELADDCYKNIGANDFPAEFMTITFDCTEEMHKKCPAVVHVDGTARPQLVDETHNPSYYRIIKEYHNLTGLKSIINTSFNMHEEPIVCSPYDAIRAFKLGHLDYLAMSNFLVYPPNDV